jgi:hypothetical protein
VQQVLKYVYANAMYLREKVPEVLRLLGCITYSLPQNRESLTEALDQSQVD